MKKIFSITFVILTFWATAQEENHGTLKVQKKGNVYAKNVSIELKQNEAF